MKIIKFKPAAAVFSELLFAQNFWKHVVLVVADVVVLIVVAVVVDVVAVLVVLVVVAAV